MNTQPEELQPNTQEQEQTQQPEQTPLKPHDPGFWEHHGKNKPE